MSHDLSATPDDAELAERVPTRALFVLLAFIIVVLLILLVAPYLTAQHHTDLRRELSGVATPLSARLDELIRQTSTELAAIHSYALTGETTYLEHFQTVHSAAETTVRRLCDLAATLDPELARAADTLAAARRIWTTTNVALAEENLSLETYRARIPIQQQRYEALLSATDQFDRALTQSVEAHRAAIQRAEARWMWLTCGLALLAILAAGAVLWLGRHLQGVSRRLEQRAREQADLFRITQIMNKAVDLNGALNHITRGVTALIQVEGAHLEQINFDRDEVEVVATAGEQTPVLASKAPYPGSLVEKVIQSGKPEVTTVDVMTEEDRPMASYLAAVCPRCHVLVVPLLSEDTALGALLMNRPATAPAFNEAEIACIRALADMAALVLRRLYLLEETRRSEQTLRRTTAEREKLQASLERRVEERTAQVHRLASELTLAGQRERQEIAQILHDDLQQQLYGLRLSLSVLRRRLDDTHSAPPLTEPLTEALGIVEQTITTTRHLAIDLSPPVLAGDGLVEALMWLRVHIHERFDLDVDIRTHGNLTVPKMEMRVLLFQIVRELLFNVVKHAATKHATVTLKEAHGYLTIDVIDEGTGFDPKKIFRRNTMPSGLGLRRARNRLKLFGGQIEVTSAPQAGTRATITVPIQSLQRDT